MEGDRPNLHIVGYCAAQCVWARGHMTEEEPLLHQFACNCSVDYQLIARRYQLARSYGQWYKKWIVEAKTSSNSASHESSDGNLVTTRTSSIVPRCNETCGELVFDGIVAAGHCPAQCVHPRGHMSGDNPIPHQFACECSLDYALHSAGGSSSHPSLN